MATKTKGQTEVDNYNAYKSRGGKLGFWEWRNAGMPARDFGQPGKDPVWTWNWTPPSLKTTIPTVTGSTTPQWGDVQPTSGFQWNSPTGQTLPTGGLKLQNVGTPTAATPAVPTPPAAQSLPGEVGLPPEAQGGNMVMIGSKWFYQGKNGVYYDLVEGQWLPVSPSAISTISSLVKDPNALTPYQQWQVDLEKWKWEENQRATQAERDRQQAEIKNKEWQSQYELQKQQSESDIAKQQNEMELIRGRAFPFGDERSRQRAAQEMQSNAFESARQSILASLAQPSDWIKRWEVQNAPNPYTPQPQSQLDAKNAQVENTSTRANMFDQMANEAQKLVDQLSANPDYGAGTPNEATVLTNARNDVINYRNGAKAERDKLGAYQADVTYLQGQPQPETSVPVGGGNAPAPAWLPMFAPGQRAGQAITRESIATPSAQQWSSAPWSVQQGLAGYTDWAGGRSMADILGNMAQMLPNNPGGGSRWSPYIGR